jgi:hypothetical protein
VSGDCNWLAPNCGGFWLQSADFPTLLRTWFWRFEVFVGIFLFNGFFIILFLLYVTVFEVVFGLLFLRIWREVVAIFFIVLEIWRLCAWCRRVISIIVQIRKLVLYAIRFAWLAA